MPPYALSTDSDNVHHYTIKRVHMHLSVGELPNPLILINIGNGQLPLMDIGELSEAILFFLPRVFDNLCDYRQRVFTFVMLSLLMYLPCGD